MLGSGKLNFGLFMTGACKNVPDVHKYTPILGPRLLFLEDRP